MKVVWDSYDNRGVSNDSNVFRGYIFYNILKKKSDEQFASRYFILGDSAYAVKSCILPPYDISGQRTPDIDFNFFHLSARINAKHAFGEINLRWEIF